jgi:hypothetical protein
LSINGSLNLLLLQGNVIFIFYSLMVCKQAVFLHMRHIRLSSICLGWKKRAHSIAELGKRKRAILLFLQNNLMSVSLTLWQTFVQQTRILKGKYTIFSMGRNQKTMQKALHWWRDCSRVTARRQKLITFAMTRSNGILLKISFTFWNKEANRQLELDQKYFEHVRPSLTMRLLARVFFKWVKGAKHRLAMQHQLRKALYKMFRSRLAKAFEGWRQAHTAMMRKRILVQSALLQLKTQVRHIIITIIITFPYPRCLRSKYL